MRLNKRYSSKVYLILSKILYLIFLVVIVCMLGNLFSPLTVKAQHCSKCQMEEKKIFLTFDDGPRSEEHTSELQSRQYLVCRLLLEKKTTHVSLLLLDSAYSTAMPAVFVLVTPPT